MKGAGVAISTEYWRQRQKDVPEGALSIFKVQHLQIQGLEYTHLSEACNLMNLFLRKIWKLLLDCVGNHIKCIVGFKLLLQKAA